MVILWILWIWSGLQFIFDLENFVNVFGSFSLVLFLPLGDVEKVTFKCREVGASAIETVLVAGAMASMFLCKSLKKLILS